MGKLEIFAQINRLVSNGLKKAATELLREYLDKYPDSVRAHKALGQVYLKSGQPRKAVYHLKKSLELSRNSVATVDSTTSYDPHAFNDDDLVYVATESENLAEEEYEFEEEDVHQASPNQHQQSAEQNTANTESDEPEQLEIKIEELKPVPESESVPSNKSYDEVSGSVGRIDTETSGFQTEPRPLDRHSTATDTEPSKEVSKILSGSENDDSHDVYQESPRPSAFSTDLTESEEDESLDSDDLFIIGIDDEDESQNSEDIDEASEEEVWDDLEDMDELEIVDEEEPDDDLDYISDPEFTGEPNRTGDRITQEQRALQIATEVIADSDWDYKHITLLQEIFSIRGWAAARVVIEQLIEEGATPEEIKLAREIRYLWMESSKYWITFHKLTARAVDSCTDAAYKQMSWLESMRIIRCFPSTPDIEEIHYFIEETYDIWYNSSQLRKCFKAFFKFLKYRTGSMRVTLPGDYPFSFTKSLEEYYDDEYDYLHLSQSQEYRELEIMGLTPDRFDEIPHEQFGRKETVENLE
ncbi:MAG: hypothetical protein R3271_01890 [Methylophaga sp.]|uniref:tetratricopeptide repeat protein n=1 Tax=Methylophaga sp. TaxID=2024840 RepID=UPI00299CF48F|nr:hypothetical protein [Methylophaga sp.]MDX1749054.1 hypothetical protein [Methylophaga sp.]